MIFGSKRRFFHQSIDAEEDEMLSKRERLSWMRLNSEKERIDKYKDVAKVLTIGYYEVIKGFTSMMDLRKELPCSNDGQKADF